MNAPPASPAGPVSSRAPLPLSQTAPAPVKTRFFDRTDWFTFLVGFAAVWLGYYLTLAPEVTLEDSGELATGSFYAGIPHPPGYPVWTLYTWLWTVLVPFKDAAWRVALGEATSGALAAGFLGLLVCRGGRLLIDGIEELKSISAHWKNLICATAGFVAALLMGFNGFMWSQSVIVEVYSFSVASLMIVLLFLLRWMYAPQQRRYLYLALFFHGICFTNHQTLVVAAIGIEVAIAAAQFRMGRYLFLWNSIIYLSGLILKQQHILTALENNQAIFVMFNVVGVASIAAYVWFSQLTKETFEEFCLDAAQAVLVVSFALMMARSPWFVVLGGGALAALVYYARKTGAHGREWAVVFLCGVCWLAGAAFYFYMPFAGMTNPPMEWGYPRTVEGFIRAFTRGQYDKANPSDVIHHPGVFLTQLGMLGTGIIEEFNWVYAFIALVPFAFFLKMKKRERAWLIGLSAIYLCLGVLLLILLNPPPDRAAQSLVRVFFTASHTIIAILVGYGLVLVAASLAAHYDQFRPWALYGGGLAIALGLLTLAQITEETFFGQGTTISLGLLLSFIGQVFTDKNQFGLPVFAGLIVIALAAIFAGALVLRRDRAPLRLLLVLFSLMPLYSILTHWADNEQRGHWFGYWFGHDMFTPPFEGTNGRSLYPEMTRNAVLFGGTDPGRFCPTYMIFCDSFTPPQNLPEADRRFNRRDVYIITQNALADNTYLDYIRAQYDRSHQIDPPFFQEFFRSEKERQDNTHTNALARAAQPLDRFFTRLGGEVERRRRTFTSWFTEADFKDPAQIASRLRPGKDQDPLSAFVEKNLSAETRGLLGAASPSAALPRLLARDLNLIMERDLTGKGPRLYDPQRFSEAQLSEYLKEFIKQDPRGDTRVRLDRLLLETNYPTALARSQGGVYPDREIYTPTDKDLDQAYRDYAIDASRRYQLNQLKPGENVTMDSSGRVGFSGQIAVMGINGLLAKDIFDHNPQNEFFVEESFPLDWMYPHLTPFGIIMKVNRERVPELTEDMVQRDHAFWTQYSGRLIGNWITYDTSIKELSAWVQRVYLRKNFRGFTGERRFVRDDQAQKSFSKLRSAIAGVYLWRISNCKEGTAEHQRMVKEADFAFRQAFAFCPYSPEVAFRYVTQFLIPQQRFDDAMLVATTCQKLDPYNGGFKDLVERLERLKTDQAQLEKSVAQNPGDFDSIFKLASLHLQAGRTNEAIATLDRVLNFPGVGAGPLEALVQAYVMLNAPAKLADAVAKFAPLVARKPADAIAAAVLAEGYLHLQQPALANRVLDTALASTNTDPNGVYQLAQQYIALGNLPKVEASLERLTQLAPQAPEAWYDLAGIKAVLGKSAEALPALHRALALNAARLQQDPKALNLAEKLKSDPRFNQLRQMPQFKQITGQ